MTMLIGFLVGVISMALIMGMCAAIGTLAFFTNIESLPNLYAGIAAGIIVVLAVVGYWA